MTGVVATGRRAVAGALGFLTRVPVGRSEAAWTAFTTYPAAAVVPGYVVGALAGAVPALALALADGLPAATVAVAYVLAVYALVGVNNLDGVADCGDAMVVHGDAGRRREVLADTTTGVGALAAVALVVVALALGAVALVGTSPLVAFAVALAAEVGARTGLAALAALGTAPHDGLGSAITEDAGVGTLAVAVALAVPAVAWPLLVVLAVPVVAEAALVSGSTAAVPMAAAGAFAGALAGTAVVGTWARRRLGGPNGDVFGAATEVARVAGLHVGVLAWTLS
ncbi:adenosylcobinamide-GDP ribazoletransferase [Halorubellus sp. PRR65]|uniref:adenosylcobinamide-GDP ribazoletransferase n=1 Tax=Halorubellus sp. PRR65 TaxID=3098148 RepID=UPI002B25FEE9|nr:adenosylcobinamide-GDP ribazoletransferase [Halorubellus sp. PRR65]